MSLSFWWSFVALLKYYAYWRDIYGLINMSEDNLTCCSSGTRSHIVLELTKETRLPNQCAPGLCHRLHFSPQQWSAWFFAGREVKYSTQVLMRTSKAVYQLSFPFSHHKCPLLKQFFLAPILVSHLNLFLPSLSFLYLRGWLCMWSFLLIDYRFPKCSRLQMKIC